VKLPGSNWLAYTIMLLVKLAALNVGKKLANLGSYVGYFSYSLIDIISGKYYKPDILFMMWKLNWMYAFIYWTQSSHLFTCTGGFEYQFVSIYLLTELCRLEILTSQCVLDLFSVSLVLMVWRKLRALLITVLCVVVKTLFHLPTNK